MSTNEFAKLGAKVYNLVRNSSVLCSLALRAFVMMSLVAIFSLCHAQQAAESSVTGKSDTGFFLLDLVGYNYTDHYIDSYSVDGEEGGNIMVSSPTSGGSGVACCVKISKDTVGLFRVRVRWQVGGCTYKTRSLVSGSVFENIHSFYKQADIYVLRKLNIKPRYIEVHFYQDGSIQAQLTERFSSPRLVMDESRADRTPFKKCKDDQRPT